MNFLFVLLCGFRNWIANMDLFSLLWREGARQADLHLETREMTTASLSRKQHSPSGPISGEQEHGSNAERNCQECSEGKRPSGLFDREGKRPNESFGGGGKGPNASFSGEKQRSNALFVDKGKRPNKLSSGEQKHGCNVEKCHGKHLPH